MWHQWSDGVRGQIPYRSFPGTKMLILGDGDLSFSTSLLDAHGIPGEQLIATCYDDEATLERKYPHRALANRERLLAAGATVILKLDATKLIRRGLLRHISAVQSASKATDEETMDASLHLTRIIFNFPHTGEGIKDRSHNIKRQQQLILGFLRMAADLLSTQTASEAIPVDDLITRHTLMARPAPTTATDGAARTNDGGRRTDEGEEEGLAKRVRTINEALSGAETDEMALIDGHGEYAFSRPLYPEPEIHLTSWMGDPYDDWNIKRLASINVPGLRLAESFQFDASRYPGYGHCRTTGDSEEGEFEGRPARTFVFTPPAKASLMTGEQRKRPPNRRATN